VFPTMNFQIRGTFNIEEQSAEFEYKANCLSKIIEIKKMLIY